LNATSHRWQHTAIAAAAIALLGLSGSGAFALSLGRLTVQSALGEPLRAEIDVPDINAEEAASLRTNVAAPEAFKAAGLEYNPAMSSLQATLQRRADGRAFIRLSSDRPINDPFVDMILETSWASGRIVRDYTMLFDPPVLRQPAPAPTLPQTVAPAAPASTAKPPVATQSQSAAAEQPSRNAAASKPAPVASTAPAPAKAVAAAKASDEGNKQVTVKSGDTASKIAGNTKPTGVSLDQMLVALLRTNPDAFVNSNINRIRAGAIMNVPSTEQAQSVSVSEASQIVVAQSKDFNEFRRNLASNAPSAAIGAADRKASGTIEAKVDDKKPTAVTPDKLTLSKGAIQSKTDEAKIAKERADQEAQTRAAEISKNIADLKKIGAASAPAAAPAKVASAPMATATPTVPAVAVPVAAAPAPAASAPESAPAPAPVAAVKPLPAPAPQEAEAPGLVDELLEDPQIPAAAGGLIALLGGFAFYRLRQRKKNNAQVDSSFLESRLQPDSFFGASGGQRVDTNNQGPVTGSSMVYSASQLDAADDVDPVAEADVYLAYGRDLQAEEILKEAVRTTPGRLAIHTKLLEIFAKRRDAKSFEASAADAYKLTGSSSPDWTRICEMGLSFDPSNPMYQPGGVPASGGAVPAVAAAASTFGNTLAQPAQAELSPAATGVDLDLDLDLDLDFSLDDEPASAISDVTGGSVEHTRHEQTIKMAASKPDNSLDMDFDLPDVSAEATAPAPVESAVAELPELSLSMDGLSLAEDDHAPALNFETTGAMPVIAAPAPVADNNAGMLEFDLGSLSLDLDAPTQEPTEAPWSEGEDPLETKLALAEEFVSIGDEDGARALIEEVVAESSGDMRAKAQRALANLS
jgi:pilus assembly protein FimV